MKENINNLAIIQARTGATRLPNKVLIDIKGKKILEHVIDRVKSSKYIDEVVVATTINKNDLKIVSLCAKNDIRVFCGAEEDVLDRYYQVAKLLKPKNVVRITADCPMHDSQIIDLVIKNHLQSDSDYTSNVLEETYPDGLDCEIMKFAVLEEAWKTARLLSEREHATQFIINNDKYTKCSVVNSFNCGNERWTLDTENDLKLIQAVYNQLYEKNPLFRYEEIMSMLNENPHIREFNRDSIRNEGLIKSLRNDMLIESELGGER